MRAGCPQAVLSPHTAAPTWNLLPERGPVCSPGPQETPSQLPSPRLQVRPLTAALARVGLPCPARASRAHSPWASTGSYVSAGVSWLPRRNMGAFLHSSPLQPPQSQNASMLHAPRPTFTSCLGLLDAPQSHLYTLSPRRPALPPTHTQQVDRPVP